MIATAALTSFIAALFSMMNPIGNLGVVAGITQGRTPAQGRRIAWICAFAVAVTLLIVTWTGVYVLHFFGISVESLRAAGGVIILLIGLNMLFNRSDHNQSAKELDDAANQTSIAIVPMTIPLVAGPGTMATVLVAAQQHHSVLNKIEISIVCAMMAALTGLLFSFAAPISKKIGESGMGVVTRVMGMILAAIAMGMLTDALKALLPGLAGP